MLILVVKRLLPSLINFLNLSHMFSYLTCVNSAFSSSYLCYLHICFSFHSSNRNVLFSAICISALFYFWTFCSGLCVNVFLSHLYIYPISLYPLYISFLLHLTQCIVVAGETTLIQMLSRL